MEKSTDIAIIGGGLAAYAAAVELKGSGREVTLVTKAPGATALSSGAWDIADDPVRYAGEPWERTLALRACLDESTARNAYHPYAVLSRSTPPGGFADFLLQRVGRAAAELPLPMTSPEQRNRLMPSDWGTLKATAVVQASMAEADLSAMDRAKILVVGITGYAQFNARFVREALLAHQEGEPRPFLEFAGDMEASVEGIAGRHSLTGVDVAQMLDREEGFAPFGEQIVKYLEGKVYSHLMFPPVLGCENTTDIVAALRRITGLKVGETLSTPMSVPGWRLQSAMEKYFAEHLSDVETGEVVGFDCEGRRITSLRIHDRERRLKLKARSFILATGKYIGGGLRRRGRFQESVFRLPVTHRGKVLGEETVYRSATRRAAEPQPFFGAGVAINPLGQPLDPEGQILFDNLFAAGGILADFDPAHERCAAGVSIASGTISARSARQVA